MILTPPVRWWHCPSCDSRDRTEEANPHTRFHSCPAFNFNSIPLIEVSSSDAKADGRQLAVEREDYIGKSNAGPIASIRTERADGSNDCTVLAPSATVILEGT